MLVRLPDLLSLRLFLSVYQLQSVTQAAKHHNIAVSAVTKRLKELEAHYGARLFERQHRGMIPNSAADELAGHVRQIMVKLDETALSMQEVIDGARGRIRIAATASSLLGGLSDSIQAFQQANTAIICDVQEGNSLENVLTVLNGEADIGFSSARIEIPHELERRVVMRDRLCAVVRADDPFADLSSVSFEAVIDRKLIGIGTASALSVHLEQRASEVGRTLTYRHRAKTCDVARTMVSAGLGVCILPDTMIAPYAQSLRLRMVALEGNWAERETILCHAKDRLSGLSQSFLRYL